MLSVVRVVLAVALLTTGAACSSGDDDTDDDPARSTPTVSEPPADAAPSAHTSLIQLRSAEGTRTVAIRVTNTGAAPFTVAAIRLVWPGMPEAAWTPKGSVFAPGQTIDLTTRYGDPDCSGYPAIPKQRPLARLRFAAGDHRVVTQALDADGVGWLHRLYVNECEDEALHAVVDVHLAGPWSRTEVAGQPYLRGWIELDRVGTREPVTVTSVFGSILLRFEPVDAGRSVATLAGGQRRLRIPVQIGSSNRCDDHGLSGATQTFLLSVFVRHGTAPVQRIIVTPPLPVQGRALDVAHDACKA